MRIEIKFPGISRNNAKFPSRLRQKKIQEHVNPELKDFLNISKHKNNLDSIYILLLI